MGGLIELIFENFFLIFLIISGIIGFLSGDKEGRQKKQQERTRPVGRQSRPSQRSPQRSAESPRGSYTTPTEREQPSVSNSATIEEEQQAQLERLQEKYGVATPSVDEVEDAGSLDFIQRNQLKVLTEYTEEQKELRNDLRKSLKKKGLINGIIMGEVLGKPRSLKPYHSPTLERYKK